MTEEATEPELLSDLGEAALAYARDGWKIFPLAPRNKIPITRNGLYDATIDEDIIRAWWTRTPDANIGFATGNGLYILDVDGEKGEDSLTHLTNEHGELPPTRICRTGKGRHFYFAQREKLGNTAGRLGMNLDTRGDGGYVVLPPSIHPDGGVYEWASECSEARLPQWIVDALEKKPQFEFVLRDPNKKVETSYEFNDGPMHRYVASFFHNKCNALANQPSGGRNHRMNELAFEAGRIVQGGLGNASAMEGMIKDAARAAGLTESEIDKTWESGYNAGWLAAPFVLPDDGGPDKPAGFGAVSAKELRTPEPQSLILTKLSKVKKEHVEFLWGNRLVRRGVNLLVGDGGLGKSTIALQIVRSITDGVELPDAQGQSVSGKAILVSYEDPEAVVQQHAKTLGIDLDKVFILSGKINEFEQEEQFAPRMVQDLMAALDDPELADVRFMVIDPWGRYLDDDDNKEKLIRRAIAPLEEMTRKRDITVLILGHTNKKTDYSSAVHRIAGHSALKNVARSIIMVGNVKGETNAVVHVKHNWSQEALAVMYTWDKEKSWGKGEVPMTWGEVVEWSADDLFTERKVTKTERAAAWLRRLLIGNPLTLDEIREVWEAEEKDNFSWATVEAAARELGIDKQKKGNQHTGGTSKWALPEGKSIANDDDPEPEVPEAQAVYGEATVTNAYEDTHEQRDFVPAPPPIFTPRTREKVDAVQRAGREFSVEEWDGEPF